MFTEGAFVALFLGGEGGEAVGAGLGVAGYVFGLEDDGCGGAAEHCGW